MEPWGGDRNQVGGVGAGDADTTTYIGEGQVAVLLQLCSLMHRVTLTLLLSPQHIMANKSSKRVQGVYLRLDEGFLGSSNEGFCTLH